MCNISSYIGNKNASPILIEMMKNQEGFAGGYYTGISTIYNGKIYCAKVLGGVNELLKNTNAINFPGNIGFIHSRSKSGGDESFAQPFLSNDENLSVCLNGKQGEFKKVDNYDNFSRLALSIGAKYQTMRPYKVGSYPLLDNGCSMHTSEAVCHLTSYFNKNFKTSEALKEALEIYPAEFIALALNAKEDNFISFANYNMPMSVYKTKDEVFLSSFSICMPSNREFIIKETLPPSSYGEIYIDKTNVNYFKSPLPIEPITNELKLKAEEFILNLIKNTPLRVWDIAKKTETLFKNGVNQSFKLSYEVLNKLYSDNKVEIIKRIVDGADEAKPFGIKAKEFLFKAI